ncbi:MAG: tRNA lysidine(34) synthetase TilS [Candidatus Omnitrophica bacterium]|nr:tRNA lysidine(34) synthetase TilS [Candidatus Omnitrophota bacterium]
MDNIFKKIEDFIQENKLICENDKILLAVSGGPDSVFLFHFFLYLLKIKKIEIKVAYIHHHLREEADKEVEFVKNLTNKYSIEFFKEDIEILEKKNIEKILREKRYEKLYEIAEKIKFNKIATGHTLDDNVETIIMNFLRGCGISGLCGIWPSNKIIPDSQITVIRPLLCVEKKEIIEYLKKNGIEYLIDTSNLSLSFFRNRVRYEIIPFLLKYNPSFKKQIFKMSFIIRDEELFLKKCVEKIYNDLVCIKNGKFIVNIEKFNELDICLKRRVAGQIYKNIKKTFYVNFRIVEKILNHIEKGINVFDEEVIDRILKDVRIEEKNFLYKVNIPGITEFDNIVIETEYVNFSEKIFENTDKFTAFFDFSKIKGEIFVRNRKIGDRFKPLGFRNEKRLSRFMIDKKIPVYERDKILIFENNGKIMWVCGYEISEEFKVEENTEKILKITVIKKENDLC